MIVIASIYCKPAAGKARESHISKAFFEMSIDLTEAQMREALFGFGQPEGALKPDPSELKFVPSKAASAKSSRDQKPAKSLFPKLRVTLHVTKIFEGPADVLVYESRTLSTIVAEQEAKAEAKKKKYKYIEVISVVQV